MTLENYIVNFLQEEGCESITTPTSNPRSIEFSLPTGPECVIYGNLESDIDYIDDEGVEISYCLKGFEEETDFVQLGIDYEYVDEGIEAIYQDLVDQATNVLPIPEVEEDEGLKESKKIRSKKRIIESEKSDGFIPISGLQNMGLVTRFLREYYSREIDLLQNHLEDYLRDVVTTDKYYSNEAGTLALINDLNTPTAIITFGAMEYSLRRGGGVAYAFKVEYFGDYAKVNGPDIYNLNNIGVEEIADEISQTILDV